MYKTETQWKVFNRTTLTMQNEKTKWNHYNHWYRVISTYLVDCEEEDEIWDVEWEEDDACNT